MATKKEAAVAKKAAKAKKTEDTKSRESVIVLDVQALLIPGAILLGALMIALVLYMTRGGTGTTANNAGSGTGTGGNVAADDPAAPAVVKQGSTTIDDDPKMGSEDAKVAIVEFSDYECPFCKRHFTQTAGLIKEEFIDTGKVLWVYRDFPLSFHDPLATKQAMAAECVQDLSGDAKYFEYHDKIFETTASNGQGMAEDLLYTFAKDLGVNEGDFKDCYDSEKFKDEVASDIEDGVAAGVSGTPGFVIGVLNDKGEVEGEVVAGAQPYSVFKSTIEKYLNQ